MSRIDTAKEVVAWWARSCGEAPKGEWFSSDLVFENQTEIVDVDALRAFFKCRVPCEELELVATVSEGPHVAVFGRCLDAVTGLPFRLSLLFSFVHDRIERVLVVEGLGPRSDLRT